MEQEETCLLGEEEKKKETAFSEAATVALEQMPSVLKRQKTGEEILINKPVFRIGKEKGMVDYCISDNRAVSRSHAQIITREDRFFILDLHSTNKTYVNDAIIPAQKEIEIFGGDRIKLADEAFKFLEFKVY